MNAAKRRFIIAAHPGIVPAAGVCIATGVTLAITRFGTGLPALILLLLKYLPYAVLFAGLTGLFSAYIGSPQEGDSFGARWCHAVDPLSIVLTVAAAVLATSVSEFDEGFIFAYAVPALIFSAGVPHLLARVIGGVNRRGILTGYVLTFVVLALGAIAYAHFFYA